MKAKDYPSQERLNYLFEYRDGELFWKNPRKKCNKGLKCGYLEKDYLRVNISGSNYLVHRIIYIMHHGNIPPEIQIDHSDNCKRNNKIQNLRPSNHAQNQQNTTKYKSNTSGFKGVSFHRPNGKWRAKITINKREQHLGLFNTPEEAAEAYNKAALLHHKEFACS